jgi:hypothetical protein
MRTSLRAPLALRGATWVIKKDFRQKLLKDSVHKLETLKPRPKAEWSGAVQWLESHPWFSDWQDVSLFRSLERRQRTSVY